MTWERTSPIEYDAYCEIQIKIEPTLSIHKYELRERNSRHIAHAHLGLLCSLFKLRVRLLRYYVIQLVRISAFLRTLSKMKIDGNQNKETPLEIYGQSYGDP